MELFAVGFAEAAVMGQFDNGKAGLLGVGGLVEIGEQEAERFDRANRFGPFDGQANVGVNLAHGHRGAEHVEASLVAAVVWQGGDADQRPQGRAAMIGVLVRSRRQEQPRGDGGHRPVAE